MADFSHNLAVVIGIDQYGTGINTLQTAVNDVKTLAYLLQQEHQYQVIALTDKKASLSALQNLLTTVLPQQVQPDSRLLFYFAGHGIALNGDDGPQGYLIPQDAEAGETSSYLAMTQLQAALSALPCRHFLGILDCCFAGAFRWSSTRDIGQMPNVVYRERYDRFVRDPAWQILTSAAHDQTALDAFSLAGDRAQKGRKHSPFAAALIEALQGQADAYPPATANRPAGDGVMTATELYLYLRDRVELATEAHHRCQTPGLHPLKQHDKGEFIFLTPGHPLNLPSAPPLNDAQNPYRGLQAFEAQHSKLFFGRCKLAQKLQQFVSVHPLCVVLGASGSGKSSLVKAGLIPQLQQNADEKWCILSPIRPGETPFRSLNKALVQAQLPSVEYQAPNKTPDKTLSESIAVWACQNPNAKLLLFIDQSEEMVTLCLDESVQKAFFQQILSAIAHHRDRLRVVLTLRSDFEPQIRDAGLALTPSIFTQVSSAELKQRWQQERFVVPAMTRSELREAIEKPAEARVMHFEPHTLIDQLVEEVADMPGALPLLSFALSELYLKYLKRQRTASYSGKTLDRAITQADYYALGGVVQSLTQRADEEYQALIDKQADYGWVIRHVMLRMVTINGGELARRRVPLSELVYPCRINVLSEQAIAHFSQARLLIEGQDAEGNACIEPAHDALVRGWQRLQSWISKEKNIALQRRLSLAATEWHCQTYCQTYDQKHHQYLWHNNPYLDVLNTDVLKSIKNNWLNQIETEFVQQSLAYRRRSSVIRWSLVNAALLLLSIAAGIATKFAVDSQNRLLESASLSAESMFASEKGLDALEQAVEAGGSMAKMPDFLVSQKAQAQVIHALQTTVYGIREKNRFGSEWEAVSVDFSAENRLIVTGLENGSVVLWSVEGERLQTLTHGDEGVFKVGFTHQGQVLVTASKTQGIKIWQQQPDRSFEFFQKITPVEDVMSVAISESSQTIASSSASDNTMKTDIVTIWDLKGNAVKQFAQPRHSDRINDLSFSPSGQLLATGSADKTVKVWDLNRHQWVKTITVGKNVFSLLFVNEDTVAVGTTEGTVELWDISSASKQDFEGRHGGVVHSLALSPDGKKLISASENSAFNVWRIADRKLIETVNGHEAQITDISFTEASNEVISTSKDNSVRLWQLDRAAFDMTGTDPSFSADSEAVAIAQNQHLYLQRLDGTQRRKVRSHAADITEIAFSPQGGAIASADANGTITISTLIGDSLASWKGHQASVTSLRFSPDGKTIVSGSLDTTIKQWSLTGRPLAKFASDGAVTSVEFSPNGKVIASAGRDQTLRIWHLDNKSHQLKEPIEAAILDISFSSEGNTIASASEDGFIHLWNLKSTSPIYKFRADREGVNAVKFIPNSSFLISGGTDGAIKQWDTSGNLLQTLYRHNQDITDITLSPHGEMIASSDYPSVIIRSLAPETLLKSGCQWLYNFHQTTPARASPCSDR
ncbi:MAG: caspase family protein [Phormidesmis sp.]